MDDIHPVNLGVEERERTSNKSAITDRKLLLVEAEGKVLRF